MNVDAFAALLMGLAGAGHCLMMCGGLAGALGQHATWRQLLLYNCGRITSYAAAGALLGAAFTTLANASIDGLIYLRLLAALLLVLLGLYYGGWWLGLRHLEAIGKPFWRLLQPLALRSRNGRGYSSVILAGMVWGWLPCGLVYSALSWAALSGSASSGAWYMMLFGLGTLPAMMAFGWLSKTLQSFLRSQGFRQLMGLLLIAYGLWTAVIALRQLLAS
ncbi:sulfite exporter TauE/SafE family protein [Pseudidiomarina mangrovi]|uniref:sulfite exporter TauE/SafE family protein n=1 Tax=Pseudidiomarina mangrovi TaxID=2487133 RepID=UPI000FCBD109|nr:sulfite exporter TauE/SafE family protein [Pseudidiomarina mangrovi]